MTNNRVTTTTSFFDALIPMFTYFEKRLANDPLLNGKRTFFCPERRLAQRRQSASLSDALTPTRQRKYK
jgi:hypothetical protein